MKTMKWIFLLACIGSGIQAEPATSPEAALRAELKALIHEHNIPGATAAFVLADGRFGEVAVGIADRETGEPMRVESRMLAASIGKTFVGAAALAMTAEGGVDLDAPVSRWLQGKEWFDRFPEGYRITLRQLLTHRSGLPNHVELETFALALRQRWAWRTATFTAEELVGFVLELPLEFPPGVGWSYSDTGYVLAGMILEQASGKSLYEEVESRFLIPLGLTGTSPSDRSILPGLIPGYTSSANSFGFPEKSTDSEGKLRWNPAVENFGGGWVSTAGDLARWGHALYDGEVLSESAQTELLQTLPISEEPGAVRYGIAVSHHPKTAIGSSYGHGGWIPGYVSSLRHYPRYGFTVAFQINADAMDGESLKEMELRLALSLFPTRDKKEIPNDE